MADPAQGVREMRRVTRRDGVVAACVWDHGGGRGPLSLFWDAARSLDPSVVDESGLPGSTEGQLHELFTSAGLSDVEESALSVTVRHPTFEKWWEPFRYGVGPAGTYVGGLEARRVAELARRCRERIGGEPFEVTVVAWTAYGRVP
jgi:hypothetical protein